MFSVIYQFDVREGKDLEFIASWKELTKFVFTYEGSLGSRLHKEDENKYIAYAQWPERSKWEHSGKNLPPEADNCRKIMREACHSIETIHTMEMTEDLLKKEVH